MKPISLLELSVQLSATVGGLELKGDAVAIKFVGSVGTVTRGTFTVAMFDAGELPNELKTTI
jgi:hypothetical protein